MMNDLLRDIIEAGDVAVFIDDVMMGMEMKEGYNNIVEEVLRRMVENDLFVKPEKYVWKVRKVGFSKVVIRPDRVKMEKEKVQRIINWSVPRSVKDMQKFLGLAKYYRQFVKDFTSVAKPLHKITRKDVKWSWEERQWKVFEELKESFMIKLVLITPNLNKEMRIDVDVSDFAIGGVLLMKCEDEKWRLVAYISKLLNKAKRDFKI